MDEKDQIYHFAGEIDKLIDRYRDAYQMSYAAAVGVLQLKIHGLCSEAFESDAE